MENSSAHANGAHPPMTPKGLTPSASAVTVITIFPFRSALKEIPPERTKNSDKVFSISLAAIRSHSAGKTAFSRARTSIARRALSVSLRIFTSVPRCAERYRFFLRLLRMLPKKPPYLPAAL